MEFTCVADSLVSCPFIASTHAAASLSSSPTIKNTRLAVTTLKLWFLCFGIALLTKIRQLRIQKILTLLSFLSTTLHVTSAVNWINLMGSLP